MTLIRASQIGKDASSVILSSVLVSHKELRGDTLTREVSMLVRSSPALRAAIRTAAEAEEMPINEWVLRCLATAVGFQRRDITRVVGHLWEAPPGSISGQNDAKNG